MHVTSTYQRSIVSVTSPYQTGTMSTSEISLLIINSSIASGNEEENDSIEGGGDDSASASHLPGPPSLRLRWWVLLYSTITACLLALLVGTSLAFSSPVLLELTKLSDPDFRFSTRLSDIFGVSDFIKRCV